MSFKTVQVELKPYSCMHACNTQTHIHVSIHIQIQRQNKGGRERVRAIDKLVVESGRERESGDRVTECGREAVGGGRMGEGERMGGG